MAKDEAQYLLDFEKPLYELEQKLDELGWEIAVEASGPFYWGAGNKRDN